MSLKEPREFESHRSHHVSSSHRNQHASLKVTENDGTIVYIGMRVCHLVRTSDSIENNSSTENVYC